MLTALRLMSMLTIACAASAAHALENSDWDALEDTAQHSLEYASTDESVPWVNPDSGTEGTFTPVATHEGPEGQVCREYAVDAIIDGREEVVYGTACRLPDGSWVEANAEYSESDPLTPATEVHSGTDWSWIIRNIAISGGYCSNSFCVGGQFGSYYPSWYNPWGFSFSYWDYGRRGYYYPLLPVLLLLLRSPPLPHSPSPRQPPSEQAPKPLPGWTPDNVSGWALEASALAQPQIRSRSAFRYAIEKSPLGRRTLRERSTRKSTLGRRTPSDQAIGIQPLER